jgi:N-acetylmuramoyl-L-alanine amidase
VISSPEPTQDVATFNWADPNAVHHAPAPKRITTPTVAPVMPVAKINAPPSVMPAPIGPAETMTWSSLNRWTAEHKIGAPRFLTSTPLTTYEVNSPNGEMILAIGSREANWNGVEINLGFAPELIDGQIFLHALDLRKNLEPLLCAPPLAFGTNRVIVIDPGHGGMNVGTHSVLDGRFEKEFTLDWAQRLKPLLEANGWTVFLTRTSDTYVTNSDRVVFAEAHHADVFISLHFNSAAPDTKQAGLETYCLTPTEMASTLTRGYSDNKTNIFPNNFFDAQNLQLTVRLHSALLRASGEEDRGIRRARFMEVLIGQKRPAILIEGGYLSNPHEAKRIEDPAFRQKLAEAAAAALK